MSLAEDPNLLLALPKITATAAVQCHQPCVPECTREHDWDKGENK